MAGLLWVAGMVLLIVGTTQVTGPSQFVEPQNLAPGEGVGLFGTPDHGPVALLYVGIGLVGVARLMTAGSVLARRRR